MGTVKKGFTALEMSKADVERRLVKAIFGCEIDEMPDTPESELIRMEFEDDLRRAKASGNG